jgi:hypothetical protein
MFAVCAPATSAFGIAIGQVSDVPELFAMQGLPMVARASLVFAVPYDETNGTELLLKPSPVSVIVVDGAPAMSAADAERLDAVIVGGRSDPSVPTPKAPAAVKFAVLPSVFVTMMPHLALTAPAATVTESLIVVELVTVGVPSVTSPPEQAAVKATVAPEVKPPPMICSDVVPAVSETADGLTVVISLPTIEKIAPDVVLPPSAFSTVTV